MTHTRSHVFHDTLARHVLGFVSERTIEDIIIQLQFGLYSL